ncbi:MAG: hypothetical protein IJT49_04150 [Clostridia bacterium]|nr:hypothetical protein [Clostridia bacterium]
MKKFVICISVLLCALFVFSPFALAQGTAKTVITEESVLNISEITEEQAQLCAAVMLDGFEGQETERAVSDGTVSSVSVSAFEGEKCMRLTGNGKAELTLKLTKKRSTANTRSLCVCAFVDPAENTEFIMSVTVAGAEKTVAAKAALPSGKWYAAYMPIDTKTTVNIESITVNVSANGASNARVSCLVDRVHTSTVDGLPDRLKYFASDFTANRGEIKYTSDALIFTPTGSNSYMESSLCGYMTNGLYNALAVRLENNCDGKNVTLRLKLDKQYSYTEENSHTLELVPGEHVYNFPIGGFRSGASVGAFRLELPGAVSGNISVKSISFSSYRFPAEYGGSVTAETAGGKLKIYGALPDYPASSTRICLYRLTPGVDEEEPGGFDTEPYAEAPASSSFNFELPLTEGDTDNTYFKYLVRYETKTGYEDAGVAYVNTSKAVTPDVLYKGAAAEKDTSVLSYLMPDAVYADVDIGELFTDQSETELKFAGKTAYISDLALAKYDGLINRCSEEKIYTVLRFVYSPFADSEKYYSVTEKTALPDITTDAGTSHYMALLSFFAKRYGGAVSAVIPCGTLDARQISEMRGILVDKAEKYAADLLFTAQSALAPYGISVIAPVSADGAEIFLGMFWKDVKEPEKMPVYVETDSAEAAAELLEASSLYPFRLILSCKINDTTELVDLYCGCRSAAGICVRGIDSTDSRAELFSVIDTTYGAEAADRLAADGFPDGVASVYPDITKASKQYVNKGTLDPVQLPQMLTTLCDGETVQNWWNYDCCKSIYTAPVNGENAAGLAFDFTSGCFGYAAFSPDEKKNYGKVYFRLYADYLPEDVSEIKVRIFAESDKGVTAGSCTLEAGEGAVVSMDLQNAGKIKRFTFAPLDISGTSTPRICVLGIYTAEKDSSDTITEAQTETMPEPESQMFETAEETQADAGKESGARLYITAILVILGMFALCGAVILVLKKRDTRKTDKLA